MMDRGCSNGVAQLRPHRKQQRQAQADGRYCSDVDPGLPSSDCCTHSPTRQQQLDAFHIQAWACAVCDATLSQNETSAKTRKQLATEVCMTVTVQAHCIPYGMVSVGRVSKHSSFVRSKVIHVFITLHDCTKPTSTGAGQKSNNRQVPHVMIRAAHPMLPHTLSLSAAVSPQRLPAYISAVHPSTTHRSCHH